jgi:hypothetical protein
MPPRDMHLVLSATVTTKRSSLGGRSSIRDLSNAITERFASIRDLTRGAGSAPRSRGPSTNWEKMGGDPFSPEVSLMAEARAGRAAGTELGWVRALRPITTYTNPFSD